SRRFSSKPRGFGNYRREYSCRLRLARRSSLGHLRGTSVLRGVTPMLEVSSLRKSFGGVVAISDVSLSFPTASLTAIIGPNGAGKSTFFNLISGGLRPDSGSVRLNGVELVGRSRSDIIDAGIGRAFQVAQIFPTFTVEQS